MGFDERNCLGYVFDYSCGDRYYMTLKEMKRKAHVLSKDLEMGLMDRTERYEYFELCRQIEELEADEAAEQVDRYIQKRKDKE